VGEVNLSDREYAIGRGLAAIRAKGCDANFLFHALKFWRSSLQRVGQGTTFDAVTARHFAALHVAIPTRTAEQVAIARILDAVDTALERTCRLSARAEDLFAGIVGELLGRGIARDGELRDCSETGTDFVVSSLGRLPRDWRISTVGNEFEVQSGFTINDSRRPRLQQRRYLRVANHWC